MEEEKTEMIKTSIKEPLPKNKSYPIGAEAISIALEGVSQLDLMSISFYMRDEYWASQYNKKLADKGDITVLEVGCHAPRYEWKIVINSVPSKYRGIVREQLLQEGFMSLKKSLKNVVGDGHGFIFKAIFNLGTEKLTIST